MTSLIVALLTLACLGCGALAGTLLRRWLPSDHVSGDSKDAMKLGTGLIGTMAALVLGLLVASAKNSYDTQKAETTELSANVILLDRLLTTYGPEGAEARARLRTAFSGLVDRLWANSAPGDTQGPAAPDGDALVRTILLLPATSEAQQAIKAEALATLTQLGRLRMLMFAQLADTAISVPFLVVVVSWLTVMFFTFGLLSPRNVTVATMQFVCAVSAAAAVFLILELDRPFTGIIRISSAPARVALSQIGQ